MTKYFFSMPAAYDAMKESCHTCTRLAPPPCEEPPVQAQHQYHYSFHTLSLDHVGPLHPIGKYKYLLSMKCLYSGWPELIPVEDTSARTSADVLTEQIFPRYGPPPLSTPTTTPAGPAASSRPSLKPTELGTRYRCHTTRSPIQ